MNRNQEGLRIILEAQRGRIRLCLTAAFMGRDLCITLSGGDRPHIGAVALAGPRTPASALTLPSHREGDLARKMADRLSSEFGVAVCVACGVHLDAILEHEIKAVLEIAEELTEALRLRLEGLSHGDGEKP